MLKMSESHALVNFNKLCNKAVNEKEKILITRTDGNNIVIISEEEYNNLIENIKILGDPERYKKIKDGINQIEGNLIKR